MPFLTLVATATGKSSRALEEQIVLTNIIYTLIFIENDIYQVLFLLFHICFLEKQKLKTKTFIKKISIRKNKIFESQKQEIGSQFATC